MFEDEKFILPEFPRTRHLPLDPHATRDDLVATQADLKDLLSCSAVYVEEKVDGANSGVCFRGRNPVVRNRSHILNKGYIGRGTPAKEQFAPIWTWVYAAEPMFRALEDDLGFLPSVYGEWLYARHSVTYDALPSLFMAYDIYDSTSKRFVPTGRARQALQAAGFAVVPLIGGPGPFQASELLALRDGPSQLSTTEQREGIYLKGCDETQITHRFKMVGGHFATDPDWVKKALVKNRLLKQKSSF